MIKTFKIKLLPNNKQKTLLYKSANVARFVYNWTLNRENENYKQGNKFIFDNDLRKEITQLKKKELYFLNEVSNNVAKQAVKDACVAFKNFFNKKSKYPKFKSKKNTLPKFYCDGYKTKVKNGKVLIEKIGWINLAEKDYLPENYHLLSARVSCKNNKWYISFCCEIDNLEKNKQQNKNIGVDLGLKEYAVLSDGVVYKNINKDLDFKRAIKRFKRLQRKVSRQYNQNKGGENRYQKTNNIIKTEKRLSNLREKISNIKTDYIQKTTSEIVKTKQPAKIVMEDLNVKGMMKNKKLAKSIQDISWFETYRQFQYKCDWYGVEFITADRFYPSSKICNSCGNIKKDLELYHRIYRCKECGHIEDRDLNAAKNLELLAN